MATRIIIIGAGGHGHVVADILRTARAAHDTPKFDIVGALDDNPALTGSRIFDIPILGTTKALSKIPHDAIVVAIGDNALREQMTITLGADLYAARHPHATGGAAVEIGPGSMISAGVVIAPMVMIGTGVILNTRCSVDHHCLIGSFAHIAPGVTIGGNVTIGVRALIGLGASVMPGRRVGANAIIGAGAVVVDDIPDGVVAVGVPARVTRHVTAEKG
jgi:sugar O-acyltransferase (sialic acid O-acetyltransferase NeuD family)